MNQLTDEIVLLNIFQYFSIKELNSFAKVCRSWKKVVDETIQNRKINFNLSIFEKGNWKFTNGIEGLKSLEIEKKNFISEFKKDLSKLMFEPKLFIYFLTEDFFVHLTSVIRPAEVNDFGHPEIVRKYNFAYATTLISNLLPKKSIKLFLCSQGFIGNDLNYYLANKIEEPQFFRDFPRLNNIIEEYKPFNPPIGGLLLASSKNYRFSTLQLINETEKLLKIKNKNHLNQFFGVEDDEILRLIVIFIYDFSGKTEKSLKEFCKTLNKIRSQMDKNSQNNFVVTGCSINDAVTSTRKREYKYINEEITFLTLISKKSKEDCVKISQMFSASKEDNFDSDESDEDLNEHENDYQNNKQKVFNHKVKQVTNSIGETVDKNSKFKRFTFVNTNENCRKNKQRFDEASLFKANLPDYELFGCIGFSLIGHDFFPIRNESKETERTATKSNKINYDVFVFEQGTFYCTVYTTISLD